MPRFEKKTTIPCSAQELFDWHAREGAFERLAPPTDRLEIREKKGSIYDGDILEFAIYNGPVPLVWRALHQDTIDGVQFCDVQVKGPFQSWRHIHRFVDISPSESILHDEIEYTLPLAPISSWADGPFVRSMLEQMFDFRHQRTMQDIKRHQTFKDQPRQVIAITGATGLVGTALTSFLTTGGHTVRPVVRKPPKDDSEIYWRPSQNEIDAKAFEGVDVVIHLAGANVAGKRWSDDHKKMVMESRRQGTRLLAETLAGLDNPPHTFLSASAVGFYGSTRGDEVLTEASSSGDGFLAEVCRVWEENAQPARDAGIRTVNMRIGLVLDPQGGVLEKMLTPFKLGTGGKLGDGKNYMSWIAMDDILGAINHLMFHDDIEGAVNLTAPNPVTNAEFTDVLGDVLGRPTFMTVPRFALNTALGKEMAQETVLASQRALPQKLQDHGFEFAFTDLLTALNYLLGK